MVKRFTYRGDNSEEWSNTYHFRDAPPSTSADWLTLANALALVEQPVLNPQTTIVRAYGYDTDDAHPVSVWSHDWSVAGTPVAGTFVKAAADHALAGDQAYFAEWQLDHRNSRGKWVYLRKYLHGGASLGTDPDTPAGDYALLVEAYAAALGNSPSGFHGGLRARTGTWPIVWNGKGDYITTRTLKRRGKRPPLAA